MDGDSIGRRACLAEAPNWIRPELVGRVNPISRPNNPQRERGTVVSVSKDEDHTTLNGEILHCALLSSRDLRLLLLPLHFSEIHAETHVVERDLEWGWKCAHKNVRVKDGDIPAGVLRLSI